MFSTRPLRCVAIKLGLRSAGNLHAARARAVTGGWGSEMCRSRCDWRWTGSLTGTSCHRAWHRCSAWSWRHARVSSRSAMPE